MKLFKIFSNFLKIRLHLTINHKKFLSLVTLKNIRHSQKKHQQMATIIPSSKKNSYMIHISSATLTTTRYFALLIEIIVKNKQHCNIVCEWLKNIPANYWSGNKSCWKYKMDKLYFHQILLSRYKKLNFKKSLKMNCNSMSLYSKNTLLHLNGRKNANNLWFMKWKMFYFPSSSRFHRACWCMDISWFHR